MSVAGSRGSARSVRVGVLPMGSGGRVLVQTMWKGPLTRGDPAAARRLEALKSLGCDIVRFAVPTAEAAETLGELAKNTDVPLVADIHFDHKIALACLEYPIAKLRINPGNIGASWKVAEVVAKAKDRGVPVRIGVNSGSLPQDLRGASDQAAAMVEAARRECEAFEALGFRDIVVSAKSSDVADTVAAYRELSKSLPYPLHLGLTEAGPLIAGTARTAVALGPLLREGIGDTIRVSLSDSMENEVIAAREILGAAGLGVGGARIVSCPRCARAGFDTHAFLERWAAKLYSLRTNATIAVMGCAVNGPGEASKADLGITGAGDSVIIFKHGALVRMVRPEDADSAFAEELESL
jgi:(E)-4-hydroxy-3-methylbut-2-enyl-diphosphate synthase